MLTAHCTVALPDAAGVPEWLHIMPAGTFKAVDGRGPYHLVDAQAVIAASMAAGRIPVDENHSTNLALAAGNPSPARGWIIAMEPRADGIWARIEWNQSGTALMTDRAYRAVSPVYQHQRDGTVLRITSVALTNNPGLTQLQNLFTNQETGMDPVQFRTALGLPETADEAAILARVTELAATAPAQAAMMTRIAQAAGATEATPDAIITAIAARQAPSAEIARMTATITGLETQVATLRADQARAAATAEVDAAIRAGKPVNALRDHYITRMTADPDGVRRELAALPSIHDGGVKPGAGAIDPKDIDLTADDRLVIAQMNLDPEAFKKTKASLLGGLPQQGA